MPDVFLLTLGKVGILLIFGAVLLLYGMKGLCLLPPMVVAGLPFPFIINYLFKETDPNTKRYSDLLLF